jgi:hypothetical protein
MNPSAWFLMTAVGTGVALWAPLGWAQGADAPAASAPEGAGTDATGPATPVPSGPALQAAPAPQPAQPAPDPAQPASPEAEAPHTSAPPAPAGAPAAEPSSATKSEAAGSVALPEDTGARDRGPAQPIVNLALNLDTVWNTSRSFDLFSDDDVARQIGLSGDFIVWRSGALSIAPGLGWGSLSESDTGLFNGAVESAELESQSFYADLALRYEVWSFLEPHARLAGGLSFVDLLMRTNDGVRFEDDGGAPFHSVLSPFVSVGAGFTLKTMDRMLETRSGRLSTAALGLAVEGGYTLATPVDFALLEPDAGGRIDLRASELGDVERSGPYLRVALVGRL